MTKPDPPLIAHVIHHLVVGGMENGVVNLINRMPPHRYRHCVICVEDYSEFRDRIVRPDVQVVALRKSTLTRMDLYRRLCAVFRQHNPTIVHSRNLSGLDALLPAWSTRVPVRVHSEHGWDVDDLHGTRLRPRLLRRVHRPLRRARAHQARRAAPARSAHRGARARPRARARLDRGTDGRLVGRQRLRRAPRAGRALAPGGRVTVRAAA